MPAHYKFQTPNKNYRRTVSYQPHGRNSLYVYFQAYFDKFLAKSHSTNEAYSLKSYVSVDKNAESIINDFLSSEKSQILPIIGYRGIGKTHFLLAQLKKYYDSSDIVSDRIVIVPSPIAKNKGYDLIAYCTHERDVQSLINLNSSLLLAIRIKAINAKIEEVFRISATDDEIDAYIRDSKGAIMFYDEYSKEASEYAKAAMRLKYYLSRREIKVNNFLFIYDDLESMRSEQQNSLVLDLLAFSECMGNAGINNKTKFKFIFCTRVSSYSNISASEQYDTHRTDEPLVIHTVPQMVDLFEKRFEEYESDTTDQALITPQTRDSWETSRNVLIGVSKKGFTSENSELLQELCNYDMSEALNKMTKILANVQWTQIGNYPIRSGFTLSEYDFHINNPKIMKILLMGENVVFHNIKAVGIASPYLRGGNYYYDYITFCVLQHALLHYEEYLEYKEFAHERYKRLVFSQDLFIKDMSKMFTIPETAKEMEKAIIDIFEYLHSVDYMRIDNFPSNDKRLKNMYYLRPRGYGIYRNITESTAMFEIIRDSFIFERSDNYDLRCSCELKQEEIFIELFKYIKNLWEHEERGHLQNVLSNHEKEDVFHNLLGDLFITELLLYSLESSIERYYWSTTSRIPESITETLEGQIIDLRNDINDMRYISATFPAFETP